MRQRNHPLDRSFSALSDPTRRAILKRLADGPATVGELAKPFAISPPAISKHLKVLEKAGLMRREVKGRVHNCYLQREQFDEAMTWLAAFTDLELVSSQLQAVN